MLLRAAIVGSAGFSHAFPTRDTPDAELLAALGGGPIVQVKQVHGARAVLAPDAKGAEGDALVARAGGGPVGMRVADCVPVLVASVKTGDVAAIHAGWRGVVAGVVGVGVRPLAPREDRADFVAAIGPCIGPCCFEVGREVGAQIGFGFVVREEGEKVFVDLRAAVRAQLEALGVHRVEDVPGCTKHEAGRFHSFRRDGANSGRMLAAIAPRATKR